MKAKETNQLKNINFLAWHVGRKRQKQQRKAVHRALFARERLRHITKH